MAGSLSWKRLGGAVACVGAGLLGAVVPALVVAGLLVAILFGVIAAEQRVAAQRRARNEPSPLEQLAEGSVEGAAPGAPGTG
jgi:hypothetical protein